MKEFFRIERLIKLRRLILWAWLVYYLTWSTWSEEAFAQFVSGLGRSLLWQVVFLGFLFLLTIEIIYRFRKIMKNNILLALFWLILPSGILLFLSGFFLSATMRMETRILTGKEDIFQIPWSQKRYGVMDIKPSIKERFLDIEQESPSPIFTTEPVVLLTDFRNTYRVGVYPPRRIDGTFFHILNFNIAPSIEVKNREGELVLKGDLALRILPAGSTDYAVLEGLPYRITMKLLPSKEIKKGDILAKEYNLNDRLYELKVFRIINPEEAGTLIAEGKSVSPLKFDNYTITVTGHTYWVLLEIVKDDAVYVIVAGLILIITGLIFRIILLPWWLKELKRP
ncbi:MAG: hypothetical protein N2257_00200 [Thermodesulfovibrionales bacterium]|nr:hypothetical protein [Thermodesulfovibrionales bacterium]